jgi:amidase
MRPVMALAVLVLLVGAATDPSPASANGIEQETISSLADAMAHGRITSEQAIRAYLARIAALDRKGPRLNAIIALNPNALAEAKALDAERKAGKLRGPLHGVPILIKDNIEVLGMPTTAGSLALAYNDNHRDASVVAALRAQGALILGKTNLSEWANIRSNRAMSGWSAIGGLTRNPYALDRTTCGSSSGSGAAVAAGFAPAALGSETDGSVICPSSMTGLVGLKPTIGLVPRTHIVPISHSQDTAGPMAHSVRDVALLFSAMIGSDAADPATREAMAHAHDYAAALDPHALQGMRIGFIRSGKQPQLLARYDAALAVLKAAGATLVEVQPPKDEGMGAAETKVLQTELRTDLNAYLATTSPHLVKPRTLADLIAFNEREAAREMPLFGQETFLKAEATKGLDDPAYVAARAKSQRLAGKEGIDAMLAKDNVLILVLPSMGPAWPSDTVWGDVSSDDGYGSTSAPAVAGYPHLTVPMGLASGLPVGLSFIGTAYSEQLLLNAGYAYEQAAGIVIKPAFSPTVDAGPPLEGVR